MASDDGLSKAQKTEQVDPKDLGLQPPPNPQNDDGRKYPADKAEQPVVERERADYEGLQAPPNTAEQLDGLRGRVGREGDRVEDQEEES